MEQWRQIPGLDGCYSASSIGRVRLDVERQKFPAGTIVSQYEDQDGYMLAAIRFDKVQRVKRVHRLVYVAFFGEIPEGMTINHKNGLKADNRIENLEVLSRKDNILHAIRELGQSRTGERNPSAKLNPERVIAIRNDVARTRHLKSTAEKYGVSTSLVSMIARGDAWSHVGGPRTQIGYGNSNFDRRVPHNYPKTRRPTPLRSATRRPRTG